MGVDFQALQRLGYASNLPLQDGGVELTADSSSGNPITNSFYGINLLQTPLPVPMNKDHHGFAFFTRPQLNLQTRNLKNQSFFYPLLTSTDKSIYRALRCYLDPRLQFYKLSGFETVDGEVGGLDCALVDPYNAFIPLLSNHIVSLSGFPDKIAPIYSSPEGQYKEVHSMIDGTSTMYGTHSISATFRNARGNPITRLIDIWLTYGTQVFEGLLVPYTDYLLANLIDYNTRIYRIVLDPSKRKVQAIGATGASTPISVPLAQRFDMQVDRPYNDANAQINVNFHTDGVILDDDILIWTFNRTVGAFHPHMWYKQTREKMMSKVPYERLAAFNCRAYPRIDVVSRDLEWWVAKEYFEQIMDSASRSLDEIFGMTMPDGKDPTATFRSQSATGNNPKTFVS